MKSAIKRIGQLFRLTSHERQLLLYAWCLFPLVALALRILPATRLVPRGPTSSATALSLPVDRVGWLVKVAGRYAPARPTCLTEALVLTWMLRRQGIDTTVRIGVARDARGLRAHAWLEQEGRVIFGSFEGETYRALRSTVDAAPSA